MSTWYQCPIIMILVLTHDPKTDILKQIRKKEKRKWATIIHVRYYVSVLKCLVISRFLFKFLFKCVCVCKDNYLLGKCLSFNYLELFFAVKMELIQKWWSAIRQCYNHDSFALMSCSLNEIKNKRIARDT